MKLFNLERSEDESGVSGTGVVAQGVVFDDGTVAMRWVTENSPASTCVYDSMEDVERIHGHGGRTECATIISVAPIMKPTHENATPDNGN